MKEMDYVATGYPLPASLRYYPVLAARCYDSLAVRVHFDDRAELLAAAPDVYYVTHHYLNYNAVLVRLSRVTPGVLQDLLGMAHKFVTARRRR
jgi:hypothetical protein